MASYPQDGWGIQPIDITQALRALRNNVISGCAVSPGTNDMTVQCTSGTVIVDGSVVSVSAQDNVSLAAADGSNPRKDLVYIASDGTLTVQSGTPEAADPSGETGRDTERPTPPNLGSTDVPVLAEVWVASGVSDVTSGDISDRRVSALVTSYPFAAEDIADDSIGPAKIDPSDGSDGQVIKRVGGVPQWAEDQVSSGGTTSIIEDAATNGNVLWGSAGTNGTFDPATTSSPVQDAIDAINNQGTGGGAVILPFGVVDEAGPITGMKNKSIFGWGTGQGFNENQANQHASSIHITGGGRAFHFDSDADYNHCYMDGFTVIGEQTAATPALELNTESIEHMNMGHMRFTGWDNDDGIILFDGATAFTSRWGAIYIDNSHGAGLGNLNQANWLGISVGHYECVLLSQGPAIKSTTRFNSRFGYVQTGHSCGTLFEGEINDHGALVIANCHIEPSNDTSARTDLLNKTGAGWLVIGAMSVLQNGGYDQIYNLGTDNGRCILPKPSLMDQTAVSNAIMNVTAAPAEESWYWGPSSEIQNDAGSSTGRVRSMATAGAGNA